MKFYISPENQAKLEKKLNSMFKHLETKPLVTFSSLTKLMKNTVVNGISNYSYIDAIEVNIEDVKTSDWVLVATVDYRISKLLICDSRYFKDIPAQYGVSYTKCDHCGNVHTNRVESHILYNEKTGQWMQVGSTCINKMIDGGKYLNGLMAKILVVINTFCGCEESLWNSGFYSWTPSSKFYRAAVKMEEAMMVCKKYMDEESNLWEKSEYDDNGKKVKNGTNSDLINIVLKKQSKNEVIEIDKTFIDSVKAFYDAKEYGEVIDEEKTLTQKIKDAFTNEFICVNEMYLAWFSIVSYLNDISTATFEQKIKTLGIEKGQEFNFFGNVVSTDTVEAIDWRGLETYEWLVTFKDNNTGLVFKKQFSDIGTIEKYKNVFGIYAFTGKIKYIAYRRQYIGFGGRLKKTQVKKSKKVA